MTMVIKQLIKKAGCRAPLESGAGWKNKATLSAL
jgi:hypothetical protein